MPSYNINISVAAVDRDASALLEVVERVAAGLRPALPEHTAIEHVHVTRLDPDDGEDADTSILIEAGDTLAVHIPGGPTHVGLVQATAPANARGPALVTLRDLYPTTPAERVANALKGR